MQIATLADVVLLSLDSIDYSKCLCRPSFVHYLHPLSTISLLCQSLLSGRPQLRISSRYMVSLPTMFPLLCSPPFSPISSPSFVPPQPPRYCTMIVTTDKCVSP